MSTRYVDTRSPAATPRFPLPARVWVTVCAAATLGLVGARTLHYLPFPLPLPVEQAFSLLMHYQIWGMLGAFLALPLTLLVLASVLLLLLVRRRWCLARVEGRWYSRPWLSSLMWALVLLYNVGLDTDPKISLMCWTSMASLFPALWGWLGRTSPWKSKVIGTGLWAAFFSVWAEFTREPVERAVTALWAAFIVPFASVGVPRSFTRDRLWLALSFSMVAQFALSELPRRYPNHGGTQIGVKDYAYTFCDMPEWNKLFAAVPCDGTRNGCTEGFIAEHDTRDLTRHQELSFFSDSFRGRLVHLVCLENTVQVGMAKTMVDGREHRENLMEFSVERPEEFRKSLFGDRIGPRLAYDRRHHAIFYISEWKRKIYRFDRETEELDENTIARSIYGSDIEGFGSHIVENSSFHDRRDSIFFVQWLTGSKIFEIDRTTLALVQTSDAHHGGSHGVAIDDELDRIWVTGIWGIDVLEVGTGRLLSRSRLGLGCRLPVIDRLHDIVYVPNSSGRLWAIDRRTFKVLGSLLVGGGSRNPYITQDGTRLLASAQHGYFFWQTAELADRFR